MRKEDILEILVDWNFWEREQDVGKKRPYWIKELESISKIGEIVTITGVRRCGKSTLLLQFCRELLKKGVDRGDILIVNLEDPRFRGISLELLNRVYEVYLEELNPSKKHYVILDEVQAVGGWEKFVRFLHENKKIHVFVTGSTSKLLESDYSSVITGRHIDLSIYPLSFNEYLDFKGLRVDSKLKIISKRHEVKRMFKEYVEFGGFPKVCLVENGNKKELLKTYFSDIITKDILLRHKLIEKEILEELAKYYLSNISSMCSFNKLKNIFGISLDTVGRFSGYLSSAYLLFFIKKFSYKVKEQILNPRKVYCMDTGLRNAVSFRFMQDLGRLYENAVAIELKRRNKDIYYWRDYQHREIDFVIKEGQAVNGLIQVCYNIEDDETKKREVRSLLKGMDEFKLNEGLVITEDYESEEEIKNNKIIYKPLWKWLLEQ